jgi:hypothetical protein
MSFQQSVKLRAVVVLPEVTQLMRHDVDDAVARRPDKPGIEVD